jgi:membrane fusion protein, copper/silver efflux system
MRRYLIGALLIALACRAGGAGDSADSATATDMTPEEHARMQAGGSAGATDSAGLAVRQAIQLTPAQERALGVTYTTVTRDSLTRSVRTVGQILAAEPRIADVTPKIEGFVERLLVDATGRTVRRGEPLLELYSPMLVAAQEELLAARRLVADVPAGGEPARHAQTTLDAARRRLAYWDVSPGQIERLETTGEVRKTLTLVSPVAGIVLEKDVISGQQVMPGMRLYRIADLSVVWVEGEVFEQDLKFLRQGAQAHIEVAAYPGEHLMGRVAFVYPTVDTESRTNRVRVTVPNPDRRLKPGMFATLFFDAPLGGAMLTVPMEAVVVTGERNLVFARDASGVLHPREVVLGVRAGHRAQVLSGLSEGETIVASANFLVDAESRLAITGGAMPGTQHGALEPDSARRAPAAPPARRPDSTGHRHD